MQRLINLLFYVVFILALALVAVVYATVPSHADTASDNLRATAVMINGVACSGSGGIVEGKSGKRYLLTDNHVCNCASEFGYLYATREGGELIKALMVKRSWAYDLCAARVEDDIPALRIGTHLVPFTKVHTRGYPMGRLVESHGRVMSDETWNTELPIYEVGTCPSNSQPELGFNGNIEACNISFTSTTTNLYGRPGSSGSPVVNDQGYLVGVLSSWLPGNDFDAGMVRFEDVRRFLSSL